jgi:hypothetical protein
VEGENTERLSFGHGIETERYKATDERMVLT